MRYLYGDHLGSVSVATNAGGVVVSNQHFDPWGKVRAGNVSATRRGFTGQYLDESGVMYYNARYYDPGLGRFISPDTIVPDFNDPQDLNRYSYVKNNPVRHTDPSGHCIGWVWGAADCHFVQSVDQLDWDGAADNVQTALDVAGLIPGIGEPFDAANAAISAARGDMVGAGLSAAAMVPLAGGGASAGKLLAKYGDEAATLGKTVYNPNGVLADWGHIYAQRVDDLPGYFDIIGHGTADAMEDMSAAEVAKYLKENGAQLGYAGEPLRLLSCSTGASPCGFAQQLANEMGVDVLAPSTDLLVRYDGAMSLVPPDGIWRLFTPQ